MREISRIDSMQLWMFEHPPVSWDEVYAWVESVARIPRDHWRATYYAQHWNVADKIAHGKGYNGKSIKTTPQRSIS